jgi:hypothetical protein
MVTNLMRAQERPGPALHFFSDELHKRVWPGFMARAKIRRTIVVLFTVFTLLLDYLTSPTVRFPAFYAIPILIMAWYEGFLPGFFTGLAVVTARLGMETYLWSEVPWSWQISAFNASAGLPMIAVLTWFTALAGRLSREVKLLWGLVPICMYCHRIRDEKNAWWKLELYLESRSQAAFTHGVCPTCFKTRTS